MILIIDTTDRSVVKVGFGSQSDLKTQIYEKKTENQSSDLLKFIEEKLQAEKINIKDIKAVLVNQGPGSYTGTRVGVAIANTLAWSLNIPVIGYSGDTLEPALKNIKEKNFSKIALPIYE
jgi:tRNA threonylcarbamoyladenosine biosynthesis protein TsaB